MSSMDRRCYTLRHLNGAEAVFLWELPIIHEEGGVMPSVVDRLVRTEERRDQARVLHEREAGVERSGGGEGRVTMRSKKWKRSKRSKKTKES